MDFYLHLPSNTGDYANNTLSRFKVKLPTKIDLDGDWEVALVEIAYPITWFNVSTEEEGLMSLVFEGNAEYRQKSIPFHNYSTIDSLCDGMNYTLDNMQSFNGERANFNFVYDAVRHRVGLKPLSASMQPNVNMLILSPQLQYMLGFKNKELGLTVGQMEVLLTGRNQPVSYTVDLDKIKWSTKSDDEDFKMIEYLNAVLGSFNGTDGRKLECKFVYRPDPGLLCLEGSTANISYVKMSESLQYRLGLRNKIIYPNTKNKVKEPEYMKVPGYYLMAEHAPDIRAAQYSIFVYCDVVRPQIVGNTLAPILRAVSIRGKYGDIVDERYDNAHYVPVLKKEFSSIEININDDRGRLVNFEHGKLFVKLHFRMKP